LAYGGTSGAGQWATVMFKALTSILKKWAPGIPSARSDEMPIYESLAMTEELREALFPTTPQMVSTIFDRMATQKPGSAPVSTTAPYSRPQDRGMPILE